jgi:hypothetical protein
MPIDFPKEYDLLASGELIESNDDYIVFDWWGGNRLKIQKGILIGDWDSVKVGDWLKVKLFLRVNSYSDEMFKKIYRIEFLEKIQPPKRLTEEELRLSYSKIKSANLTPIEGEL